MTDVQGRFSTYLLLTSLCDPPLLENVEDIYLPGCLLRPPSNPSPLCFNPYYCIVTCVAIPFILGVRLVDAPAGVTQEEGHTGFLHLSSAVLASLVYLTQPASIGCISNITAA